MTEISRERRAELRGIRGSRVTASDKVHPSELRALLDYADQRDEAVVLLQKTQTEVNRSGGLSRGMNRRIDALLRRVGGNK